MLKVANRKEGDYIHLEELLSFPCTDLHTIDRLWAKYSQDRFGFSTQRRIYESIGGKVDGKLDGQSWMAFGRQVGWRNNQTRLSYDSLTFDTSAPEGHLPVACWWNFFSLGCYGLGCKLLFRMALCKL